MFDLYRLNLATGRMTMFAGPRQSARLVSVANRPPAHADPLPAGRRWSAEVPDRVGGWREIIRGAYGIYVRILGYPINPRYAWALSNRGRKSRRAGAIGLRSGSEDVLYEHPTVDIDGGRVLDNGAEATSGPGRECRNGAS